MSKYIFILTLLSSPAWSVEKAPTKTTTATVPVPSLKPDEYAIFDGSKYKIFTVFSFKGLTLSSDCKASSGDPKCKAFLASSAALPPVESKFIGNPAAQVCEDLKGDNLIAFNSKKNEYNFCVFADGSMVNSWSLYYKRFPKNVIK